MRSTGSPPRSACTEIDVMAEVRTEVMAGLMAGVRTGVMVEVRTGGPCPGLPR